MVKIHVPIQDMDMDVDIDIGFVMDMGIHMGIHMGMDMDIGMDRESSTDTHTSFKIFKCRTPVKSIPYSDIRHNVRLRRLHYDIGGSDNMLYRTSFITDIGLSMLLVHKALKLKNPFLQLQTALQLELERPDLIKVICSLQNFFPRQEFCSYSIS